MVIGKISLWKDCLAARGGGVPHSLRVSKLCRCAERHGLGVTWQCWVNVMTLKDLFQPK